MAILSNINGLFAVEDNGAIKFNNLTGTNNQVLIANTNSSPTWVDVSTIIGGPYLPLTGGTLAGAGNLVVGGTLTVNGVTTLNAALTGTTATFTKDQNSDTTLKLYNPNTGTSAGANMYITNTSANADGLFLGAVGVNAGSGGFIADSGIVGSGTGASGGLVLMAREASSGIRFYTGGYTDLALSINSSQNATFTGGVTAPYYTATNFINVQVDDAEVYWTNTANNDYWVWKRDASNNFILDHYNGSATSNALKFNSSQSATFAGNIYSGLNGMMEFRSSGYNNRQIGIDSQGFYVFNPNAPSGGRYDLKINDTGNATFAGNVGIGVTADASVRTFIKGVDTGTNNYQILTRNSSDANILAVRNDGNVGIGTTPITSPNSADTSLSIFSGQDCSIILKDSVETWEIYQNDDLQFSFGTTPTTVMTMQRTTGNVGIRTTTPGTKLDVNGAGSTGTISWANDGGRKRGYLYSDSAGVAIYSTALNTAGIYLADNLQIDFRVNGAERMRITSGGQLQLQGSSSSLAKSTTQTQFAYIPGNTPGASLMPENPSGMSSASAGYHIVYGANNSSPYQAFIDVITYQCGSSTNVTVISSTTLNNSPGSRSYSKNSNAVFLNISGSVNYNCNIKTTFINFPH